MPLTTEQLAALRTFPLGPLPNKVRLARTLIGEKQNVVAAALGFSNPQLSEIERGEYKDIPLENARPLSEYFGCRIEDLFPARDQERATA